MAYAHDQTMKKLFPLLIFLILASGYRTSASHLMGGEITWDCIKTGPNAGKFKFKVKEYRDCNGIPGDASITLTTNAPGQAGGIFCSLLSQSDISPVGPGCPTCANPGGALNAVEEFIYESAPVFITGVPPATGWYFYYTSCCRNGSIINLSTSGGLNFTLRAIMFPYNATNTNPCFDSSPQFAERPQLSTCTRNLTSYNHNAIDEERDSLVYSWGQPLDNGWPGTNYPFAAGYAYNNPLPSATQNPLNVGATLDAATGVVTFTSYTQGAFVTVTKVTSYKCGIKVAEIYREIQIALLANCIISGSGAGTVYNTPPDILINPPSLFPGGAPYIDTVFVGDTVKFDLIAFDFEALPASAGGGAQTLTFTATGAQFGAGYISETTGCLYPPCATLTPPTPVSTVTNGLVSFYWRTDCNHLPKNLGCVNLSSTYNFVIKVFDNFCPSPAVNFNTFTITVLAPPPVNPPTLKCADVLPNGNVHLTWQVPKDTGEVDTNKYFNAYLVYRSTTGPAGPFTLIDSVFKIDTTYTDLTANANLGSVSYKLETRTICDLYNPRPVSGVISTIFLQVTQVGTNAQLNWTALFNPLPLPSSSKQKYYIYKESLPAGSGIFNLIDSVAQGLPLTYLDPITVCDDSINYRISVVDTTAGLGCTSHSNIDGSRLTGPLPNITPPSLRCVSVLPSGDIQLSWVGTLDTASYFASYEIYQATNLIGPYIKIGSVTNYGLNTYTHIGANGQTQINYYYIRTKAGCDMPSAFESTLPSDTLASMLLQATPALGFANLSWNALRNPLLPSQGPIYSVYRRIPPTITWTLIGTTAAKVYQDIIVLCDTAIEYKVAIPDASGCISESSIDNDQFTSLGDIILSPQLKCLAVQPSGDVDVTWIAPLDPNNFFASYQVYSATAIGGPYALLTTINNYATTSYTHVGANANGQIVYYYVKTLSGCTGLVPSVLNSDTLATMKLAVSNAAVGFADLSWNRMHTPNLVSAPGPYRILRRSTGIGLYVQIGTTINLTYRDTITLCNVPYEYIVELDDVAKPCTSRSSAANSTFTYLGNVIGNPGLRCVNVLPNGNIQLNWELPSPLSFIDFNEYEIWRNSGAGFTLALDSISNNAIVTYTDLTANGNAQSYSYYLVTQSGCTGQVENSTSDTLSSIFLTTTPSLGLATLNWSALHSPLPATATPGEYNIFSTYNPAGSMVQFGDTVRLAYTQVISDCDTILNHQVSVIDASGCVSRSNIANNNFTYQGNIIDNPDLRCVKVLANGNIQLNWVAPTGSLANFNGYEIYSNTGAGFVLSSTINNAAATTWTDVNANGNSQSVKYYMVTRSGCTGLLSNNSTSDTLSSIYLTTVPTLGTATLNWTALHTPIPVTSTTGQYNVWSNYNVANTLQIIGDTAKLTYSQAVNNCDTTILHQVTLDDVSGCISQSNIATNLYTYAGNIIGNPDLRCLSVDAAGGVLLTWINPTGSLANYNSYEIYRNNGSGFVLYNTINNSAQTTFLDVPALGNTQSYSYYLVTKSGCTGIATNGSTGDTLSSIYLTTTPTLGNAGLTWTALHNPIPASSITGQYDVWSSYNASGTLAIFGDTAKLVYSQAIVNCDTTLQHKITLSDASGCISQSNVSTNLYTYLGNIVDNPDLRCVKVLANGNIQLNWIAPTSSLVNFNGYEIYRNSGSGFSLLTTVNTSGTITYTDLTANGNSQSYSFYIKSKSGCTGLADNGSTSDTLSSIYLTTVPTLGLATLNWTALHNPIPLTASTGQYNVWSDYNLANTLQIIGDTALLTYSQSVNNCDTTILHQVTLDDLSGCVSQSNIATNVFTYIGNVIANPDLRCVSVDPTGTVTLTWINPTGSLVNYNGYQIYRNSGSGFSLLTTVNNAANTSFTDLTATGNSQSFSYYMVTKSGCTGLVDDGTTSDTLSSIYLSTTPTLGLASLNWTALHNPIPVTTNGQYDVWSDYNSTGTLAMIGDTALLVYSQPVQDCDTTITHQVTLADNSGCTSASNLVTKNFTYIGNVIDNPELRCVNVQANGQIQLTWANPTPSSWIDYNQYNIWRNNGSGYSLLDSVELQGTNTYTDLLSNGNAGSVAYYLVTKSGCTGQVDNGNTGDTLRSIFLQVTGGNTTQATLNWNAERTPHLGTSTGSYVVEREIPGGSGNWTIAGNVNATTFTEPLILCIDSVNYRVGISDALGCTSKSNVDGEIFVDHTVPDAPSVRCANVLANGNVILTWVAPADTGQRFNSYFIYSSININGPYTAIDSIFSYTTTSYTHNVANAQAASYYYFMKTRTGCGREFSLGSDTLRTMKLDVLNNNGVAIVTWNPLHNPEIPTGSLNYDVYKEYPAGSWNIIGTTTAPVYQWFDTINVCQAVINYRVETSDLDINCTSSSSTDGDLFRDLTKPTVSLLDTVSLDPLNPTQVSVSWLPSPSGDVEGYILYLFNGASWDSIGAATGINSNYFIHTNANAPNSPQLYSIAAYDSCRNISNIGVGHNTLKLTAKLDICRSAIDLRWNPYINMVGGVNSYNVYVSENGGPYSLLAVVPGNNISYSHTTLEKDSTYCYFIQAQGNFASRTASSTIDCQLADLLTLPTFSYLNKATVVDVRRVQVEALVDTAGNPDISRYKLQRSLDKTGPFTTVGVQNYAGLPLITFNDYTARTDEFSYYYRVITIDSCGNDVLITNVGRTILLSGQPEFNLTNKLTWNDYEDWLGGLKDYSLFRQVDGVWELVPVINTLAGITNYIDDVSGLYRTTGRFCYRIEAHEGPGNQYGFADTSVSNIFCLVQEPHLFVPSGFTPGGKNPVLKPEFVYIDYKNYIFVVYNRWGQKVYESRNPEDGWDGTYNDKIAPEGTYVYSVRIFGTNGQEIEKNGSVTLLR